jgi:hypothetical protein
MTTGTTKPRKRGGGPRALASSLTSTTKAIFGKRGFADGSILRDWSLIVGEHLAAHSQPEQIAYSKGRDCGFLHLRIDSGSMATEMQHLLPLLIERINSYFGFKAIDRVKITQGPLPAKDRKQVWSPRILASEEEIRLAKSLGDIEDEDLRKVLQTLGRAVIGRT